MPISAESICATLNAFVTEIARIEPLREFDSDVHALRLLRTLAEVRDYSSSVVRSVVDDSLANGNISDTRLALAAGLSNSTVGKWKLIVRDQRTNQGDDQ